MHEKWTEIKDSRFFNEFYFLAIALILAFGTLQTAGTALETDKPVVSVVSCSMYPELNVGDILVVNGVEFEEIEEGDIIVYSTDEVEIPVVHRVVAKYDTYLETQGDNTPSQHNWEKYIRPEQIHGEVVFTIPRLGGLKLLAMDITGLEGQPLIIDSYPRCELEVPLDERPV